MVQEMGCQEGSCFKLIDLEESYKDCIIMQDSCKNCIFDQLKRYLVL